MALRIVFFGTPEFSVSSLQALAATGHDLVSVVTQPDRPRGRGQRVTSSEVKRAALELGVPVLQPTKLRDPGLTQQLADLRADLGVVAAYGRILPAVLLELPRLGMINVHASLLPRWRGAAPVQRAILAGDTVTGVTIMRVVEALDAGPMLARLPTPIDPMETAESLERRLSFAGAGLLVETVEALARGPVHAQEQDERLVTYAARLERAESAIHWNQPALDIHNRIRGLQPWPLASSTLDGKRIVLRASSPVETEAHSAEPGTILRIEDGAIVIATGPGAIRLLALQLEGKPVITAAAFLNGHRVQPGQRFMTVPSSTG